MSNPGTVHVARARRWTTGSVLGAALAALILPSAMAAAGTGAAVVRGTQLAYGTCGEESDGYEMTGDLVGCWWITDFQSSTPDWKHNVLATGTELFVGWIGSRYGSFETTFVYTAQMDGPWMTSPEIHGRCHHPITTGSGTGDLVGISGELSFKDVVDVNPPYYPYWGAVRIAGQEITLGAAAATTNSLRSGSATGITC